MLTKRRWRVLAVGAALVAGGLLAASAVPAASGWRLWGGGAGSAGTLLPVPASGTVDVGFAQFMVLHHDQVVVMGQTAQKRASPMVQALGRKLASDQLVEIGQLKGWLTLWNKPWMAATTDMASWMPMRPDTVDPVALTNYLELCRQTPGGMPGSASMDDIDRLEQSTDPRQADTLFLQYMIRHHQGGAPMLVYAAQHAETLVVRQAAWRMLLDQTKEVMQMGALLRNLGEHPLPAPVPPPDLQALIDSLKSAPNRVVQRIDQQPLLMQGRPGGG
ncbi:MAG TPA: DUF305 domain-containing protein [Burkholderiaceae bacterium]